VDWLGWKEVHDLISAIPETRYKQAVAWLFWTGCRVGEACAAQQKDVRWRSEVGMFEWTIPDTKTHTPRSVWLTDELANYVTTSRRLNKPEPTWPLLWDCQGHGFGRVENPAEPISPRTINAALKRARADIDLPVTVTAHTARHTYCTNWMHEKGAQEKAMEMLSCQVGTSAGNLRKTYVHYDLKDTDWADIKKFGALRP
jgi:integrase